MMTKSEEVERLLVSGLDYRDAADQAGVTRSFAFKMRKFGGYMEYLEYNRRMYHVRARRDGIPEASINGGLKRYDYDTKAVIAAVRGGLSYGKAARHFGITRNVVAGVMKRSMEASARCAR